MIDEIKKLKNEIATVSITNQDELESYRLKYLSRNGTVQSMFKKMGSVPKEQRAAVGKAMNEVKNIAQKRFDEAQSELKSSSQKKLSALDDLTLTPRTKPLGSLHPLTQTLNEMKNIFFRLGFTIAEGPEVEDDFHNFTVQIGSESGQYFKPMAWSIMYGLSFATVITLMAVPCLLSIGFRFFPPRDTGESVS